MISVRCPHLIKWLTPACNAKANIYFPSDFQLQEYCKKKSHKKCPFLYNAAAKESNHLMSAHRC